MPTNIHPLNIESHNKLKKITSFDFSHMKFRQFAEISMGEFSAAGTCFPLVFIKDRKTAKLFPVALFSLEKNQNLYHSSKGWQALYVPLSMQSEPFYILPYDEEHLSGKWQIGVDLDSQYISETQGDALFEDGQPSSVIQNIQAMLQDEINQKALTSEFIEYLLKLKLIKPVIFHLTLKNQQDRKIDGIYIIDEEKLNGLTSEQAQEMYSKGYFKAVYCMLGSQHNIYQLIKRASINKSDVITSLNIIEQ